MLLTLFPRSDTDDVAVSVTTNFEHICIDFDETTEGVTITASEARQLASALIAGADYVDGGEQPVIEREPWQKDGDLLS